MTHITISIDEETAERAKLAAERQQQKLEDLVRHFVETLAQEELGEPVSRSTTLRLAFQNLSRPMGGIDWGAREQLHER